MFELIGFVATVAIAAFGYFQTRAFVRRRLAYVEVVHNAIAPIIAGAGAWLLTLPVFGLLPVVGGFTALLFGVGVGAGVAAGSRDTRSRIGPGSV